MGQSGSTEKPERSFLSVSAEPSEVVIVNNEGQPGGTGRPMSEIDKQAMGRRIKEIRKAAALRQWQLAQILGTTQSAVHKYERGVIPEPKRLIALARLGKTSIEWILTGRHWENGSEERDRIDEETFRLAVTLRRFDERERRTLDDAMRIITDATLKLEKEGGAGIGELDTNAIASLLKGYHEDTRGVLAAALSVHRSILRSVFEMQETRLSRTTFLSPKTSGGNGATGGESPDESGPESARELAARNAKRSPLA
jgi:transcriptional regulator with XRE-family HTH domain